MYMLIADSTPYVSSFVGAFAVGSLLACLAVVAKEYSRVHRH